MKTHQAPSMTEGTGFTEQYGPFALVAGASEGLGEAFAEALAARGISLVLLARRADKLAAVATRLSETYQIETQTHTLDLADVTAIEALVESVADIDIGLVIYNAAYAPVGDFLQQELATLQKVIDVNICGPVALIHALAPKLIVRGRGGVVLMSSLAGLQGTPRLAAYASSKAFLTTLAESLWGELRPHGVDVIASCAGAIRTPGYVGAEGGKEAPGTLDASAVASQTLRALGRGPRVVPGFLNKLAHLCVGRWLPRRAAVQIMQHNTKTLT